MSASPAPNPSPAPTPVTDARPTIAQQLEAQYGVTSEEALDAAVLLVTNYANCAHIDVQTAPVVAAERILICFNGCYAGAHAANPTSLDGFLKAIKDCMCECAKATK